MGEIICKHCGRTFEEDKSYCPYCQTATPAQKERDIAALKKKMFFFIVGLAIVCAIMILWLPRNIPG